LAGVVLALVILALALWRYGVSEHEEEMREERRIERLLVRMLEGQDDLAKDQRETNRLLRKIVEELKPPPGPPVADRIQIRFTTPAMTQW